MQGVLACLKGLYVFCLVLLPDLMKRNIEQPVGWDFVGSCWLDEPVVFLNDGAAPNECPAPSPRHLRFKEDLLEVTN